MHFWIDKRSGFYGRHLVPPSISGFHNQRYLCGRSYPKPMVTPVHRFQSLPRSQIPETCPSYGVRNSRSPAHCRFQLISVQSAGNHNGSANNVRTPHLTRSSDTLSGSRTPTPQRVSPNPKLKCSCWILFCAIIFLTCAKFYLHGISMGMEAVTFCILLAVFLLVGSVFSLCRTIHATANDPSNDVGHGSHSDQNDIEDPHNPASTNSSLPGGGLAEVPPPPYHIAVMLPNQHEAEQIQIIRDSPPPSYDKAVT